MCVYRKSQIFFSQDKVSCVLTVNKVGTAEIDNRLLVVSCSVISIDSNTGMSNHTCLASAE